MASEPIIDLSIPGVIHNIYPEGMSYPKHMLDPHIGGYRKDEINYKDEIATEPVENSSE